MKRHYIIFADDDADDLELITGFFKQYNQSVNILEFKDGLEVLKHLQDFSPQIGKPLLIVMDINMPRMDGKETLAAIRQNKSLRNIPVIIYTTSVRKEDQLYCEQYSASWVNKPYNIEEAKTIARIMSDFCKHSE
jgi:CheY-like chemotaxis protein